MNTINLTIPRGYAEMSEKQIRYVAALQIAGTQEEDIRIKCLIRFAGLKPISNDDDGYIFTKKKIRGLITMKLYEIAFFTEKMDWITRNFIGINPLRSIGKYKACDRLLRDTNFIQYLDAENYYQAFLFKKEDIYLHKMMATLYQKGDKYSNNRTDKIAKAIGKSASEVEKYIAIMWMMGVKEDFSMRFKDLFEPAGIEEDEEPEAPNMYEIMQGQIRMLTEGDITKESAVLKSKTWSALKELNEKCRDNKEMQKQYNK